MAHHVFRKGGIPALASPSDDPASFSCRCSLVIKVDAVGKRATILLEFRFPLHGFDAEQHISLVYDAENLIVGEITLGRFDLCPSQSLKISRHDGSNLRILGLALRQPCAVLCPRSLESLVPTDSHDPRFLQLVALARATHLFVAFDYAWVHPDKTTQLLNILNISNFTGFAQTNNTFKRVDWTAFVPNAIANLRSEGLEAFEPPPSYADASLKRPRQSRTNSPNSPEISTPKRRHLDHTSEVPPYSPTEKATPTPQKPLSLPPGIPVEIQDAVDNAVERLLPDALRSVLSDMLTELLPISRLSPSPQKTSSSRNPMTPLHQLIVSHLTAHADEVAHQLSLNVHDNAAVELQEQLDDHRLEMEVVKEDGLAEMNRFCDAKLQQLDDHSNVLIQSVEAEAVDALVSARDKFDEFVAVRHKAMTASALITNQSDSIRGQTRATSLPCRLGE